jgi:putative effector of murein hydrolase
MNPIARNILAAIVGFVIGSVVNLGLATIGMSVVPFPEGTDVSTMEALRESMKFAIGIGVSFLIGGIAMVPNCGGPVWFIATGLLLAYIPMAFRGGFLAGGKRSQTA